MSLARGAAPGNLVHVEVERTYRADPERVWRRYTDHVGWTSWAGAGKVTLEREGDAERDGVGAIRVIANPGVVVREEVIAFEAPKRMVYRLIEGAPISRHEGEVVFEALAGGGTRVTWRCRFAPWIPGTGAITRLVITGFFRRVLGRLDRALA